MIDSITDFAHFTSRANSMGPFSTFSRFLNLLTIMSARDGETCARKVSAAIILFDQKCGEIHKTRLQQIGSIFFFFISSNKSWLNASLTTAARRRQISTLVHSYARICNRTEQNCRL